MARHPASAWLAPWAIALALPAGAAAAPGQVSLHGLPAFSNGPQVLATWDPASFTPTSVGRQYRVTVRGPHGAGAELAGRPRGGARGER